MCIPGAGVGRIIFREHPRVIEVSLPAPECAVVVTDLGDGPHAVVLADPCAPYELTLRAMTAARHLEENATADLLESGVARSVVGGEPLVDIPVPRPHLTLVHDDCCTTA